MNTLYLVFFLIFLAFYLVLFLVLVMSHRVEQRRYKRQQPEEDVYKEEALHLDAGQKIV